MRCVKKLTRTQHKFTDHIYNPLIKGSKVWHEVIPTQLRTVKALVRENIVEFNEELIACRLTTKGEKYAQAYTGEIEWDEVRRWLKTV